jgi:hypothetical protein
MDLVDSSWDLHMGDLAPAEHVSQCTRRWEMGARGSRAGAVSKGPLERHLPILSGWQTVVYSQLPQMQQDRCSDIIPVHIGCVQHQVWEAQARAFPNQMLIISEYGRVLYMRITANLDTNCMWV